MIILLLLLVVAVAVVIINIIFAINIKIITIIIIVKQRCSPISCSAARFTAFDASSLAPRDATRLSSCVACCQIWSLAASSRSALKGCVVI